MSLDMMPDGDWELGARMALKANISCCKFIPNSTIYLITQFVE